MTASSTGVPRPLDLGGETFIPIEKVIFSIIQSVFTRYYSLWILEATQGSG